MSKTISPPKPSRVSVPVSAEVLTAFQRLAKAGNMSTGKAMAEWLADTVEAADYLAATMERARSAPKTVIREIQAYALGLADETDTVLETMRQRGMADRKASASAAAQADGRGVVPPPCNTGGKVGRENPKSSRGRKS